MELWDGSRGHKLCNDAMESTRQFSGVCTFQEPTAAATEESMQALVVSKETISGGEAINQYRHDASPPDRALTPQE